jgi:hypothetical protein
MITNAENALHQYNAKYDRIDFDAAPICTEQVENMIVSELAGGNGETARNMALAILSNSSSFYYDNPIDDETKDALLSSAEAMSDYINLLSTHLELIETARARLAVVLNYHSSRTRKRS